MKLLTSNILLSWRLLCVFSSRSLQIAESAAAGSVRLVNFLINWPICLTYSLSLCHRLGSCLELVLQNERRLQSRHLVNRCDLAVNRTLSWLYSVFSRFPEGHCAARWLQPCLRFLFWLNWRGHHGWTATVVARLCLHTLLSSHTFIQVVR